MAKSGEGKCIFCGNVFGKTSIKKHIDSCKEKSEEYGVQENDKTEKCYCISAQGYDNTAYWIYFDIPANSTLKSIDTFLRDIWLECCGHLSAFEINGESFSSNPDKFYGDRSMNTKLENILCVGTQFKHDYDFGSTTTLKLKIVSEFFAKKRKNKVKLIAQNLQPNIKCDYCDELATNVCCQCIYSGHGWICDNCISKHECGEEMLLPVVNSPRVGVCAYTGSRYEQD
jgi:hypothetical protein